MKFDMLVIGPEKNAVSIDTLAQRNICFFLGGGDTLLDTLDDLEFNFRDPISYYYFLHDWPDMDVTGGAGEGVESQTFGP